MFSHIKQYIKTTLSIYLVIFAASITAVAAPVDASPRRAKNSADADTLHGITLQEVVVKKTKNHYSKKNNPAVDFVTKIREAKQKGDPHRNKYYSYRKYERISLGINDFNVSEKSFTGKLSSQFAFLKSHIDTSSVTGAPILPLSVKEKVSDVIYRRNPEAERQYVLGIKQGGIDDIGDLQSIQTIVEDVFREINLYDDDIPLFRNRFVSPLSRIAPDFYMFFLTDTVTIDNKSCIELSFAPRVASTFGFLGRLYVEEGDTTMFVRKVTMGIAPSININYIDRVHIEQEFKKAPDGSRLCTKDDLYVEMSLIKGTQSFYAHRATAYDRHSFSKPPHYELFNSPTTTVESPNAYDNTNTFWQTQRLVNAGKGEESIDSLMTGLRSVPLYKYTEAVIKLFAIDYVKTGHNSKFDIGPISSMFSHNSVEGYKVRFGGLTTANLNKHLFARGFLAYGFKDKKFKYNAELEYSFREKRYHSREFPVHSITISERFQTDKLGQEYLYGSPDNIFFSKSRGRNRVITYQRKTALEYKLETPWNFTFDALALLERQEPGPYVPFTLVNGENLSSITEPQLKITLRYAPGEKFYQTNSARFSISRDAPIFTLTHTYAPKGVLGSRFAINKTEFSAQKRFWFSAFGYLDVLVKSGHVWSKTPYIWLLTPNANMTYTIQRESFSLLNPMEFIHDSFVSWETTYWLNGAIFNYIPIFNKLKLREVVSFRGWWGTLSSKNQPMNSINSAQPLLAFPAEISPTTMHGTPYMELSAGIDNILSCLRLDYSWRLTYRNVPGIDRSGLRVALHFTF